MCRRTPAEAHARPTKPQALRGLRKNTLCRGFSPCGLENGYNCKYNDEKLRCTKENGSAQTGMGRTDMSEANKTLRRMCLYYLLLAIHIIPCANVIPDSFPTRNLSTIYLLTLCVCLVMYYAHRVSPTGRLSAMMRTLAWMALLLILLRGVKYSVFSEVGILARHIWYLYYVPMLLLPLFLFCISLLVSSKEPARTPRLWHGALALTVLFIALVLTNDAHQLVFRFQPGFRGWDDSYSRSWLFYAITVWQYALYLAAILILIRKCRVSSARRNAWLILIPFAIGITANVLLILGKMPQLGGTNIIEFPEALIVTVAAVLECCMQLGLIPTNTDYGRLFQHFSIAAQITDQAGDPVYASDSAARLTPAQFAMEDGERMDAHTALHKKALPGGYGFWQDDLTELDRLNDALEEAKEGLAQEGELIRLRSELKERQTKLEQRTRVYDAIARQTQRQSLLISALAQAGRASADAAVKDFCRSRITLLAAYIKRYANLMLLSRESGAVDAGELGLSFAEVLRRLNDCGTPGELIQSGSGTLPADAALIVFEAFESLLEANEASLKGVFVNLSAHEQATLKLTLENLTVPLTAVMEARLRDRGVELESQREENVTYLCFALPKGGERA